MISTVTFESVDETYSDRALAPRYLGMKVVLVKDFARIHLQNLFNFGILPLIVVNPEDHKLIEAS